MILIQSEAGRVIFLTPHWLIQINHGLFLNLLSNLCTFHFPISFYDDKYP